MNKKFLSILLAVILVATLSLPVFAQETTVPFVFGQSNFSQKFSPFYADTAYDQDVVEMTNVALMTTDRVGGIIFNGIEGETIPYNGVDYTYYGIADLDVNYDETADITTYSAKLREDIVFADGTPLTADDVIFTYYVYLDPAYAGSTTLNMENMNCWLLTLKLPVLITFGQKAMPGQKNSRMLIGLSKKNTGWAKFRRSLTMSTRTMLQVMRRIPWARLRKKSPPMKVCFRHGNVGFRQGC